MDEFKVILFKNVSAVLKTEKILKAHSVSHRLVPVPKAISSECGICVKFVTFDETVILSVIKGHVEYLEIVTL